MKHAPLSIVLATALVAGLGATARAGFTGQTLLGPLGPGSSVLGNTVGHGDDNDGFTSGDHIFDIWLGPDDVWQVNWPGGDFMATLTYSNPPVDLDLFLYEPGSLDDSGIYSITQAGPDIVALAGAPAGTYYLVIDSESNATAGAYSLEIVPEPATIGLLGLGLAAVMRRRRAA